MFTEERYSIILNQLKIKGMISVTELVKKLGASESTVRRDLNSLDSEGLLKKIHGGAVSIEEIISRHDYRVNIRQSINVDEKNEIAKYAASLIEENDVIYIDSGTTTELLINYIEASNITAVTNGIIHAKKLLEKKIKTFILGGEVKAVTESIVGNSAVEDIKKYNFTKGFFGTNGVDNERGYTTSDINEAMIKSQAMKMCNKAYILADESKFGEISFISFGNIKDAILITNKGNRNNNAYDTEMIGVK